MSYYPFKIEGLLTCRDGVWLMKCQRCSGTGVEYVGGPDGDTNKVECYLCEGTGMAGLERQREYHNAWLEQLRVEEYEEAHKWDDVKGPNG
jgi:hypothetical protein